jgi:hypothetical protein
VQTLQEAAAAVDLPSHHSAFCPDCFFLFFRRQVTEGIRKLRLLSPGDRVLVCVSGGKDSLVLWDLLMELGYRTEGLHIDLGIEGYSTGPARRCWRTPPPAGRSRSW